MGLFTVDYRQRYVQYKFLPVAIRKTMDLKQLRYFVVVAEERSVTRAAVRLHLTQPPLSAQLARLEHELGAELFVRHRRGVELTEAGRELLGHAKRLLAGIDAATDSVRRLGEGRAGRLTVAFVSATAPTVLAPLLGRFHGDRPDVALDFVEDGPDGVVEHVAAELVTPREPDSDGGGNWEAVLHRTAHTFRRVALALSLIHI